MKWRCATRPSTLSSTPPTSGRASSSCCPLLAADPVPHPPSAIARFCWLMAAMTVMFIPAALFMFDEHVRYPFYLAPARALHVSALADQHAAGMIMLFAGGIAMAALAIVVAMEAMIREERRQRRRDSYLYADGDGAGQPSQHPGRRRRWAHETRAAGTRGDRLRRPVVVRPRRTRRRPDPAREHARRAQPRSRAGRSSRRDTICFSPPARRVTG